MKRFINKMILGAGLISSLSANAVTSNSASDSDLKVYSCTLSHEGQFIGHGELFNSRLRSHGSDSYEISIVLTEQNVSSFIKAQYGIANFARPEWNGFIGSYSYEINGPTIGGLQDMNGIHTTSRTERYVGTVNSRQEIKTNQTLAIQQVATDSFSIHFEMRDLPFTGPHQAGFPDADYLPRSVEFDGICN